MLLLMLGVKLTASIFLPAAQRQEREKSAAPCLQAKPSVWRPRALSPFCSFIPRSGTRFVAQSGSVSLMGSNPQRESEFYF